MNKPMNTKQKEIENKIKAIQRILVIDERIPMSAAREINDNLKIIQLYNREK